MPITASDNAHYNGLCLDCGLPPRACDCPADVADWTPMSDADVRAAVSVGGLTTGQRAWCASEVMRLGPNNREHLLSLADRDLARTVMQAWDDCHRSLI